MTEEDQKNKAIDSAENLIKQGKYKEAIALLKKLRETSPEEDSVLFMMALAHYDSGDTKQAEKYFNVLFEKELKRKVFTGFAFDELVRIYRKEQQFRQLVEICEKAVAVQPEDVGLLTELGNAYLESGRAEKACEIYTRLIGMENDNPAFYCSLGEALFAAGLMKESEKAFVKAGEIDADQSDNYYFKIAVLFQKNGNHEEVERLLKKCISLNSANPLYYCSLGDSFIGLGQIEKALEAYETAARYDEARAGAYYNRLGHSLMKASNFEQAVKAFDSAIKKDPLRPYYLGLAQAYKRMGFTKEAQRILNAVDKKA